MYLICQWSWACYSKHAIMPYNAHIVLQPSVQQLLCSVAEASQLKESLYFRVNFKIQLPDEEKGNRKDVFCVWGRDRKPGI